MTYIRDMPVTQIIDHKYSQLVRPFYAETDTLRKLGIPYGVLIPEGFVMDWESILFIRGKSPVSGLVHDYFSRRNSVPVVSKVMAANIYLEFMIFRNSSPRTRKIKWGAVIAIPGYFHQKTVEWTPEGV